MERDVDRNYLSPGWTQSHASFGLQNDFSFCHLLPKSESEAIGEVSEDGYVCRNKDEIARAHADYCAGFRYDSENIRVPTSTTEVRSVLSHSPTSVFPTDNHFSPPSGSQYGRFDSTGQFLLTKVLSKVISPPPPHPMTIDEPRLSREDNQALSSDLRGHPVRIVHETNITEAEKVCFRRLSNDWWDKYGDEDSEQEPASLSEEGDYNAAGGQEGTQPLLSSSVSERWEREWAKIERNPEPDLESEDEDEKLYDLQWPGEEDVKASLANTETISETYVARKIKFVPRFAIFEKVGMAESVMYRGPKEDEKLVGWIGKGLDEFVV